MPRPLPEAERRRFVEEATKMGVPRERILTDLARLEGYAAPEGPAQLAETRTPEELEAAEAFRVPTQREEEAMGRRGAAMALGTLIGGLGGGFIGRTLLPSLSRRAVVGAIPTVAGEAAGTFGGGVAAGVDPNEAAKAAALTAVIGPATDVAIRGTAYLGGVKQRAVTPVLRTGPIGDVRAMKKPAGTAEEAAIRTTLGRTRRTISPVGGKLPSMQRAEAALKETDVRLAAAKAKPRKQVIVDKIDEIISSRTPPANPEELAANLRLERFKKFVPDFKTTTELNDWLKRIREPVRAQLGRPGAPIHKQDLKDVQAFVRTYRDRLLGGPKSEGAKAFAEASGQIQAAKDLQRFITDARGNVRPGAEAKWRSILEDKDHTLRRAMERFDKATGSNTLKQAEALASRRDWNPEEASNATFILSIIARFVRTVARGTAKVGVMVRPLIPASAAAQRRIAAQPVREVANIFEESLREKEE